MLMINSKRTGVGLVVLFFCLASPSSAQSLSDGQYLALKVLPEAVLLVRQRNRRLRPRLSSDPSALRREI